MLLNALLPFVVFVFVRIGLSNVALAIIILSKWRMLAVRPRHWPANVRANAIDLIIGLSFLIFMNQTASQGLQFVFVLLYAAWLIFLKPASNLFWVSSQAFIGQLLGLTALFLALSGADNFVLVLLSWLVTYSAARHFFSSFDEPHVRVLSYIWAYFAAALVWVLGHWLLFYGIIAQPTLLLSVIGYGLATLYYLHETDRLSLLVRRQLVLVMIAVVFVVLVFSDWGDKTL